jgi:hypothetical protein
MKLKAKDTLHVSAVKADNIVPGEEFEVSDDFGRQLVERGLATEIIGKTEEKAAAPVKNKMEDAPANKASKPRRAK